MTQEPLVDLFMLLHLSGVVQKPIAGYLPVLKLLQPCCVRRSFKECGTALWLAGHHFLPDPPKPTKFPCSILASKVALCSSLF